MTAMFLLYAQQYLTKLFARRLVKKVLHKSVFFIARHGARLVWIGAGAMAIQVLARYWGYEITWDSLGHLSPLRWAAR